MAESGMAFDAGKLLDDKYRLTERLGEGGMGCVWAAEDVTLGREVAVKVLGRRPQAGTRDSVAYKRFTREARTAAQLRSPHVAQVFGFGIHDEQPFIVMERLAGEDLQRRLLRGRLPVESVAKLMDATCAALSEAHAIHIVHRDIKPANIFFTEVGGREVVKMLDFGIAVRQMDSGPLTEEGTVIGTPRYMSPEQSQGLAVDYRSDLWSLAVVAYEALTGEHPFEGSTDWETLAAIVKRPVKPPTELLPSLPETLDEFFHTAFRRDPQQRFQSADRMAKAFDAAARGEALEGDIATLDTAPDGRLSPVVAGTAPHTPAPGAPSGDTDVVAVDEGRETVPTRRAPALLGIAALVVAGAVWLLAGSRTEDPIRVRSQLAPAPGFLDLEPAPDASSTPAQTPTASASAATSAPPEPKRRAPRPRPHSVSPAPPPPPPPTPSPKKPDNEFGI